MVASRKTVRMFISSTFEDMYQERDCLIRRVFPTLTSKCDQHRMSLINIDLNWGTPSDPAHLLSSLEMIHSEVNKSSLMISLLGERFGLVPRGEYDSLNALAIYTALASVTTKLLVYQRDPSFTERLADQSGTQVYYDSEASLALEQQKLIRRLRFLNMEPIKYSNLESFETSVATNLSEILTETYFKKLGDVFISYSRKDIDKANLFRTLLEGSGFNIWLDLVGIALGDEWPEMLAEAINESDVVLMLVSNASIQSKYAIKEIVYAINKEKPILAVHVEPVVLPDKVSLLLGDAQHIFLYQQETIEASLDAVVRGLLKQLKTEQ